MLHPLEKIDFLIPNQSQYEVLHHFIAKFYEAFVRAGYRCRIMSVAEHVRLPPTDNPHLTVGFNGVPKNKEGKLYLRSPFLACLVDPPYHAFDIFKSPLVIASCDDRTGCRFLNTMGIDRHFFLPHAVEPELIQEPFEEPQFGLVMLATFIDFEKRLKEWREKYPAQVYKRMESAAEMTFADPNLSYITAFDQLMQDGKIPKQNLYEILMDLELYIKGRDRVQLAEAVEEEPLHIFGNSVDPRGWKDYFGKKRNIKVHSAVNYSQAIQIMKTSKILLNPGLKNKEGAHERIFTGLAAGALVITSESQYLLERFEEGKELVYYRYPHLESINDDIAKYLSDESLRLSLVKKGRKKVQQGETWDQRVKTVEKELPPLLEKMHAP